MYKNSVRNIFTLWPISNLEKGKELIRDRLNLIQIKQIKIKLETTTKQVVKYFWEFWGKNILKIETKLLGNLRFRNNEKGVSTSTLCYATGRQSRHCHATFSPFCFALDKSCKDTSGRKWILTKTKMGGFLCKQINARHVLEAQCHVLLYLHVWYDLLQLVLGEKITRF